MLEKLRIKNFKAHEDTDLDLRPITIFIGPNNSGKSSIFQILMLFKQSMRFNTKHTLYPYNIRRHHDEDENSMNNWNTHVDDILIDLGDDRLGLIKDILQPVIFEITGSSKLKEPRIKKINYEHFWISLIEEMDENLNIIGSDYRGNIQKEFKFHFNHSEMTSHNNEKFFEYKNGYKVGYKFIKDIITPFRHDGPQIDNTLNSMDMKELMIINENIPHLFQQLLKSIYFVYGIRGFELFCEPLTGKKTPGVENVTLTNRSSSMGNMSLSSGEIQEKVQNWFNQILGIRIYPELYEGKHVTFKLKAEKNRLLINEGLGSQQMLHMFIPIALAEELDTIMIEEPEIHLHPGTQAELMELFMRVWKEEKKQFIMSTHSEHIIYPLLSAISKGDLKKEDVNIIFFNKEEGVVKTRSLEIDDKGRVKGGLPGFFEQNLDEIIDFLEN